MAHSVSEKGIWLHLLHQDDALPHNLIAESLTQAGLRTYPLDRAAPSGDGVLVFDTVTPLLCDRLRELSRNGLERVLAIAVSGSLLSDGSAWRLLQAGASDVFAWDHSTHPAQDIAARFERWTTIDQLVRSPLIQDHLVGNSAVWTSILRQIVEVAYFTDASVLITGESGTGKELSARLIHTLDQRRNKRELVVLDCTTIVRELSGSEFFGHERGAFTDAITARDGAFALADGGTLFLDEVGELPLPLQAELLRVVQEHTYKRVGSNTWQHTDFRLVCATNKDLPQAVARGEFRRDLYYRIASWTCKLPPLRERPEDILPLVRHFIKQLRPGEELPQADDAMMDKSVFDYLLQREYPGNVRDLKQLVSRMVYRHVGSGPLTIGAIPEEERPAAEFASADWRQGEFERGIRRALLQNVRLKDIGRTAEEVAERLAIEEEDGNLPRAARRLGVTDRALQMRRAARRQDSP
jgi:transcriptional regulator with GAF, ATPase, and Fis domain